MTTIKTKIRVDINGAKRNDTAVKMEKKEKTIKNFLF
jgi:hypothetical protein